MGEMICDKFLSYNRRKYFYIFSKIIIKYSSFNNKIRML